MPEDPRRILEDALNKSGNSSLVPSRKTPPTPPKQSPKSGGLATFEQTKDAIAALQQKAVEQADGRIAELIDSIDPNGDSVAKDTIDYYNTKARKYDPIGWMAWTGVIVFGCGILFIGILWLSLSAVDSTFDFKTKESVGNIWM